MRPWIVPACLVLALTAAQAHADEKQQPPRITPDVLKASADSNAFALDLYAQLRTEKGNVFFSPYSISTALAMTYAGARGDTATEMAKVLHFSQPPAQLHPAVADLLRLHAGPSHGYQLSVANALWGQKNYGFLPDFLNLTRKHYGAGLFEVDFVRNAEGARQAINSWVEKQTQNRIKQLVPPEVLNPNTRLVLTNAIYFKGTWQRTFSKHATRKEPFHLTATEKVAAPLMNRLGFYRYHDGADFQALELPYKGDDLSLVVLLPRKVDGLADFEKGLTAPRLKKWLAALDAQEVLVTLPKFTFSQGFELSDVLRKLGMVAAFDRGRADFSGMCGSRKELFIAAVLHKAFVDVNEEGTEAAAATAVITEKKEAAKEPPPPPVFRADHPFVFLIRDRRTDGILFVGRVTDPRL
jgi:serpin B